MRLINDRKRTMIEIKVYTKALQLSTGVGSNRSTDVCGTSGTINGICLVLLRTLWNCLHPRLYVAISAIRVVFAVLRPPLC